MVGVIINRTSISNELYEEIKHDLQKLFTFENTEFSEFNIVSIILMNQNKIGQD